MSTQNTYQIKIELDYISPKIWRQMLVPGSFSLADLHGVIQVAMGWQNCHLHRFEIRGASYTFSSSAPEMDMEDESRVLLGDILEEGQCFLYEYDFGDSWFHKLTVEKISSLGSKKKLPVCLAGERACPPEDCGSYPGYEAVVEAVSTDDPDEEQDELLEWLCGEYNPEAFDLQAVNNAMER